MNTLQGPPEVDADQSAGQEAELYHSSAAGESVHDWWAQAHRKRHAFWLSGTEGPEVWARLGVMNRLTPGATVLNIGIGLGICTRQLAGRGCRVSVLDISAEAVESVNDVATGYSALRLDELPSGTFDVALSHLVAQHMNDADLEAQIRVVVWSLKPGGVFAVQYAIGGGGAALHQEDERYLKAGAIRRTVNGFDDLVGRAGGAVLETLEREAHPCGTQWRVALIGRP